MIPLTTLTRFVAYVLRALFPFLRSDDRWRGE